MKTILNGRQPQNIKIGITQQPLIGFYSNLKLKIRLPKIKLSNPWNETASNGRRPKNIKRGISQKPLYGLWLMSS